jgi:oligopeptide transport system ATP-binding protein
MASILTVEDLRTYFYTRSGVVKAVDGVSFALEEGKTLGIVGESGSGKSVSMMSIMGLIPMPPGKIVSGSALFQGQDLLQLPPRQLRSLRGKHISMIFQDPMTALNPYLTVGSQLAEVLTEHDGLTKRAALDRAAEALSEVGIPDAGKQLAAYPHQFSGGMRQRVMIAMALIAKPSLVICDEPTTALDVTVQAQILELLARLQRDHGTSLILITHDLGVIAGLSDEVLVMYAGKPVERGSVEDIFYRNRHPYTQGLLQSIPKLDGGSDRLMPIPGLPPDPARLPPGCPFAPRCSKAMSICSEAAALPVRQHAAAHQSICHLKE